MKQTLILILNIFFVLSVSAQNRLGHKQRSVQKKADGIILGTVIDKQTKKPIEYATIAVFRTNGKLLTGGVSNQKGRFSITNIPFGKFTITVKFIGYAEVKKQDIIVKGSNKNIGQILLKPDAEMLGEVEVTASNNKVEYRIDKKIVSVSKEMTSASASAVEVLENVPSIRVDIEGNVSLRGSTGFTVLIDGKPTILDANDVLQQTPASIIQNMEIITNPSVKYAPDGTGGIINIITKKRRMQGLQGMITAKSNNFGQYGIDALLNYRIKNLNFFVGGEFGKHIRPMERNIKRKTEYNGVITNVKSKSNTENIRGGNNIRGGFGWGISSADNISLEATVGTFTMQRDMFTPYITTRSDTNTTFYEDNKSNRNMERQYYSITGGYTHKFLKPKHELVFIGSYAHSKGNEYSENLISEKNKTPKEGNKNTEEGPSTRIELKLDYTLPINDNNMFETGFQYRNKENTDIIRNYEYSVSQDEFVQNPLLNNDVNYNDKIWSIYSLFNGKWNKLGYQLGMRGEYTYRNINPLKTNENFNIDKWDIFPTVHFSYQLNENTQLMTSYSRRIDRPRGWYLEPFETWIDLYNVRKGNANLQPEYIDAMELGYVREWNRTQLSVETYYRIKHDKIERIQSVYDKDVLLNTYENVGTDYSLGIEAMLNTPIKKWWEISLTGDLFNYRLKSEINGKLRQTESLSWSTRLSNTFALYKNVKLQLDGNYRSPMVSSQGKTEGMYSFNAAVRASFFERKLSATLQVRNIFGTANRTRIKEDVGFYSYTNIQPKSPSISISISYRINNYRPMYKKKLQGESGGGESEDF